MAGPDMTDPDSGAPRKDKAIKSGDPGNPAIKAVDFQPLSATRETPAVRLRALLQRPVALLLGAALLVAVVVLWFLLTAKALLVEVEPATATSDIEGGFSLRISGNYLLRPGDYTVKASAKGYFENETAFRISDAESQKLTLTLEKKPGHLVVVSEPGGAEISVDGRVAGTTPLTVPELSPGSHSLQLSLARYFPLQTSVEIEGLDKTQEQRLTLKPAWGQLAISSTPAGATVTVGGEERGVTPLATDLLQQGEQVSLKLPGFKRWQQVLSVAAGETLVHDTVELIPADGLVQITSRPIGASITVNGSFRGTTPTELDLKPGQKHLVSLFLDGFQTAKREVELRSGEERTLTVNLAARAGSIRILTSPEDAEIRVDGKRRGSSGLTLSLPAKAHRLEVRRQGYASKVQTITPRPGLEQVLSVELLTERQARWANTPRQIASPGGQRLTLFKPEQTFTMGASRREVGRRSNEVLRDVRLERAFYLGQTEVTNSQFKAFRAKHSSSHARGQTLDTPNQPVVNISWQQAALYCNWLSEQEGLPPFYRVEKGKVAGFDAESQGYRLPTEAEWAWAARFNGSGMDKYAWQGEFPPVSRSGNYADIAAAKIVGRVVKTYNDSYAASAPVASFNANGKGLFDLGGNVSEWLNDYYGIEVSLSSKVAVDPIGPERGQFRVLRGASWRHGSLVELRLSYRDYAGEEADQARDDLGFRVARYAEE